MYESSKITPEVLFLQLVWNKFEKLKKLFYRFFETWDTSIERI